MKLIEPEPKITELTDAEWVEKNISWFATSSPYALPPELRGRFLTLYEREQLHKKIEHTKARKSETARKKAAKRQRKANRK